jgi:fumarate hydratase class II
MLGHIPAKRAKAIAKSANAIACGEHADQFPVDVFQTGSGTSTNMNLNEVIAALAHRQSGLAIHPNDDVNYGQSSNDVVPSSSLLASALLLNRVLLPSIKQLRASISRKARQGRGLVKTGRTHLMDAMPITVEQELSAWLAQLDSAVARLQDTGKRLLELPLGGTAVGTGVNADPKMTILACRHLAKATGLRIRPARNKFESMAAQDHLELPALQAGSSIMPGKVNPVIPEAVAMVCAQVMGNHATVSIAGQSGSFQLNTMMPVIAYNSLQNLELLASACGHLAEKAIDGLKFNKARMREALARNPMLVTALNPVIGYEKAAQIAKRAYAENRPVIDVAKEMTDLSLAELRVLLDPARLTTKGV